MKTDSGKKATSVAFKGISELEAEIEKVKRYIEECDDAEYPSKSWVDYRVELETRLNEREVIRTEIQSHVGKCDNIVSIWKVNGVPIRCKDVKPDKKCPGCRALLGLEAEL
jgi:hypothetical protein